VPKKGTITKNMIKLAIFDLDGTLADTMQDIAGACNYALEACGCPPRSLEEYNMLVGRGIFNLFRGALPEGRKTDEMVKMMHSHFVPYYNEHICDKTKPYPGIYEMLDRLSEKGISFAVASNKYQEGTEMLIERLFGDYEFISILGQRVGKPIKPDPQIVKEAMEAFGEISNSEVVYCGDSDVDMLTGMNAGVKTIGVTWGFRTREELSSYSPWVLADKAEDISDAILKD
jgi:phosphoglycolate phosphatase